MSDIKQQAVSTIDHVKHTMDAGAFTITVGALAEILPAFAALLSIVWMMIRIYETRTVQKLLGNTVVVDDEQDD
ncbi:MAG: hypothetical protein OEY66_07075 [Gammaproteobacteria bacterium]|nr:hypothetical protein [Gammaproteobacteria bacterium]